MKIRPSTLLPRCNFFSPRSPGYCTIPLGRRTDWEIYSTHRRIQRHDGVTAHYTQFSVNYEEAVKDMLPLKSWRGRNPKVLLPLGNWWGHNPNKKAAIGEMGCGIHLGVDGLISVIAIPRQGVKEKVTSILKNNDIDYLSYSDPEATDQRFRCGVVVSPQNPEPLNRFLAIIDEKISPLGNKLKSHIRKAFELAQSLDYRALAKQDDIYNNLPDWHDIFNCPPIPEGHYHPFTNHRTPGSGLFQSRYESRFHRHIPKGRTELGSAIIAGDLPRVKNILQQDPDSIFRRDAYNQMPLWMGLFLGNYLIFLELYKYAEKVPSRCSWTKRHVQLWAKIASDKNIYNLNKPHAESHKRSLLEEEKKPPPTRHEIHHACIMGETAKVIKLLNQNPDLINLPDPLQLTPAHLAAGEGHAELLAELLQRGAATEPTEIREGYPSTFGLLQCAANAEIIEILLKHRADPNKYTTLVHEAAKNNDLELLKQFYHYGRDEKQDDSGLTPFDWAVIHANTTNDCTMLQWLLDCRDDYVASGPYDSNYSDTVIQLMQQHNAKIEKRNASKQRRPKLTQQSSSGSSLITKLRADDGQIIKAVHKRTVELTENERKQIRALADQTFRLQDPAGPITLDDYYTKLLPTEIKAENNSFTEQCFINDEMASFAVYTIIKSHHQHCGDFKLFYGQLACVEPKYASMGLANLIFRIPLAMKLRAKIPILMYGKTIRPGLGWSSMAIPEAQAYPQYFHDPDFVKHIVSLTGEEITEEEIREGIIDAILQVDTTGRSTPTGREIDYYRAKVGKNLRKALPYVCYIYPETIDGFIKRRLRGNGFTRKNIGKTADLLEEISDRLNHNLIMPMPM